MGIESLKKIVFMEKELSVGIFSAGNPNSEGS
jgi:hypothetical protein